MREVIISDIYDLDRRTSVLATFMQKVDLNDLPDDVLLDLKNAHTCLYLAFENALIENARRRI